jgi:hypothetical protein
MSNPTFDLYLIQSATQRAKEYAAEITKLVRERLIDDAHKDRRVSDGLCKWCYYRRAHTLAGQAFTEYVCMRCDQSHHHHNTAVPKLCAACVKETGLCSSCCGDIHGKRRKAVP